jgi:hypothetical protein
MRKKFNVLILMVMVVSFILPFSISADNSQEQGVSIPLVAVKEGSGYFSTMTSEVKSDPITYKTETAPVGNPLTDLVKGLNIQQDNPPGVKIGIVADNGEVSFTPELVLKNGSYILVKYDVAKLEYGLWEDAYTRIYTIGGPNRIAEISNYPRAYRDTAAHVYSENVSFTVSEGDLNDYGFEVVEGSFAPAKIISVKILDKKDVTKVDIGVLELNDYVAEIEYELKEGVAEHGIIAYMRFDDITFTYNYNSDKVVRYYRDRYGALWKEGEKAAHFVGEPLPGAFPLWLEYTDLQPVDRSIIDFDKAPQPLDIKTAVDVTGSSATILDTTEVSAIKNAYLTSSPYQSKGTEHQIVYVQYIRKILGE